MDQRTPAKSKKADRQQRLINAIAVNPGILIRDLAQQLGVSRETIRRDFDELGDAGILQRRYGGAHAVIVGNALNFDVRQQQHVEERQRIARCAADLIGNELIIMLAPGTTALILAETLASIFEGNALTVITSGLREAQAFARNQNIRVIMAPGDVDPFEGFVWGNDTASFISGFSADLAIFFADALNSDGIFESDSRTAAIVRTMLSSSRRNMLLMDHFRFDRTALQRICLPGEIDTMVADTMPGKDIKNKMTNTRIVVAPG